MSEVVYPLADDSIRAITKLLEGPDPYLSLKQASDQVGIPLSTLSDAVRSKRVPALVMPDKRHYVRRSVIQAYARQSMDVLEHQLQAALVEAGLLTTIKAKSKSPLMPFNPVKVAGKPVSETLLDDRGP